MLPNEKNEKSIPLMIEKLRNDQAFNRQSGSPSTCRSPSSLHIVHYNDEICILMLHVCTKAYKKPPQLHSRPRTTLIREALRRLEYEKSTLDEIAAIV